MAILEKGMELALTKFFDWLGNPFRKGRKIAEIMLDSTDVRELSKGIVENGKLCVDFCYLVYAYNGRKKVNDHRFKYRALVSGYHTDFMFEEFQVHTHRKLPVDHQYSILIDRVIDEGCVILEVWKMEESWLRSELIYLQFNMIGYYLVDMDNDKHEGWMLVVGSKSIERSDFETPAHKTVIKHALGDLKIMIDSHRK